ncbi:MAG: glycosyltransferase [Kaiparowitsia implicata GSE-PSE-MK54-09C]|jgi:hypothetical protein|nr:glycosyltransferase [Kaiparowitsia implicata GSE-PSE-MK54-09C]
MLRVDIGCGDSKPDGYVGVDIHPGPGVDIVADISQRLPFDDNTVDELRAYDVVEHLPDRLNTMNEIWRVCKPGARVDIYVPSTDARGAFQDPTHISFWNIHSFYYFCLEYAAYYRLCRKYGFHGAFRIESLQDVTSAPDVIHVHALLEVVKPPPQLVNNQLVWVDEPQRSPYQFPAIAPLTTPDATRPFWSVMIPVHNPTPALLNETLSTVLNQPAVAEMQIELVDDASDGVDVAALVQAMGSDRLSYHRLPQHQGAIATLNTCLQRAQGQWVHLLHPGDLVLPQFYTQLRAGIEASPQAVGAAFCRYAHIDDQRSQRYLSEQEQPTAGVLPRWLERIAVAQRTQLPSLVVKRATYEAMGGFLPEAGTAADWEMAKRIAACTLVWYEPQPLACYRLRSPATAQPLHDTRRAIDIAETYLPASLAATLSAQARDHYAAGALTTAQQWFSRGDWPRAIAQLQESLQCSQSDAVKDAVIQVIRQLDMPTLSDPALLNLSRQLIALQQSGHNPELLTEIKSVRDTVAQQLLNLQDDQLETAYANALGKAHQLLVQHRVK